MKMLKRLLHLLLALMFIVECFFPGNTAAAFSVGEEKEVGEQLLTLVRKEFDLIDEPDIIQYINELGQSTLEVAGSQYFDYHFFVINNNELNAFAAPSGLIFFHSGLIESLENEGELVGVVAHEIGHVVSRHLASRMSKSAKINAASMLGVLVGVAIGAGPISEAIISGSVAAGQSATLSFSRLDEEEADRLAYKWMQDQNRDPSVMVNMLRKIHNMNRYRQGDVPPYLLTHPGPDIRMSYIQDLTMFGEKKPYIEVDEFPFKRFKSRIISRTKDPNHLIRYHSGRVSDKKPESIDRAMDHYILSQAYLATADYKKAEEELARTMMFFPDRDILKSDMGVIYLRAGRYPEALSILQEARKADRRNAYTAFNLAMALEKNNRAAEAAALYEELLISMPSYSKLNYQLANIKATLGNQGEGYYYYGYYYWYEGDLESAKHHFSKAKSMLPKEGRKYNDSVDILKKIAKFEKEKL